MNWQEIKEKYPKSYSRYDNQYRISSNSDIYGEHHPDSRVLYDFFDEQDLFIDVGICDGSPIRFWVDIYTKNGKCLFSSYNSDTGDGVWESRTEAEEQAFIKAFEILEGKL